MCGKEYFSGIDYRIRLMIRFMILIHVVTVVKYILLTKTAAAQNEDALSYHRVRGLYFQAVVFVVTIGLFACFMTHYHGLNVSYTVHT